MNILDFSNSLPDFREAHKIIHLSTDIVFITDSAIICEAEDWKDIEYFGHCKESFFRKYWELPNGIPSHDTFNFICYTTCFMYKMINCKLISNLQ